MERILAAFAVSALIGCTGELATVSPGADAGAPARDGSASPDARPTGDLGEMPGRDLAVPPGDAGERDTGPTGPCVGVTCGANASCDPATGACVCAPGFVDMGGSCEPIPPGDPAGRTVAEVCDRWNADHVLTTPGPWTMGPTDCDPGTLDPGGLTDTFTRINLFRWLGGIGPVVEDTTQHDAMMECAIMMHRAGSLSHSPGTDWPCYTMAGAQAASRANLAISLDPPAGSIDQFMRDRNTPSLGHRRWIMRASAGSFSFGSAGRASCLGVIGPGGGSTERTWTAYPNPGPAPIETTTNTWSFQSPRISLRDATATVTRVSDGMALTVTSDRLGGGGVPPALGIIPEGWTAEAGESYRVTIADTGDGDITYTVDVVDCSG